MSFVLVFYNHAIGSFLQFGAAWKLFPFCSLGANIIVRYLYHISATLSRSLHSIKLREGLNKLDYCYWKQRENNLLLVHIYSYRIGMLYPNIVFRTITIEGGQVWLIYATTPTKTRYLCFFMKILLGNILLLEGYFILSLTCKLEGAPSILFILGDKEISWLNIQPFNVN
jgi:hypothetical protein